MMIAMQCIWTLRVHVMSSSRSLLHARTKHYARFESGVQLTRFETGQPASKRVKGCESGRNICMGS